MVFFHQYILHNDYSDFFSTSGVNLQFCASFYNPLIASHVIPEC